MTARLIAFLLVAALVLGGCEDGDRPESPPLAADPSASPVPGGHLIAGVYGEPATFDPYAPLASDLTLALARPLYRSLYGFDDAGEPVPDLVREIEISRDFATITLVDASWSDGTPITSRDVAFSIGRARPHLPSAFESVRRRGSRRVVLVGRVGDWPATLARMSYVLPANGRRVYSGPFTLSSRVPGLQLVLRANPASDDPPLLDRLTIRFTEGLDMLLALLQRGDLDVAWLPSTVNVGARLDELGLEHDAKVGWETIVLDLDDGRLTRSQRRGVARALDRVKIAEAFVRGHGRVTDTLPPNPAEAGTSGPFEDVFRGNVKVDDVPLRLAAPAGDELLELVQRLSQVQLDSAGFDVELINVDARRFYGEWATEAPVDAALRRRAAIWGGTGDPGRTSLRKLPLFQVDTVVAWGSDAGPIEASADPHGPLAHAHEWYVSGED